MRFSTYFLHILPLTVYIFYLFLSKNRSIILFMKTQLILSISVVAAVSLLASCSSTKVQPDTYDNSETVTIFKIDSASTTASNEDSYSEEKLNSARSFSDKLLNKNKYDKKEEMTCFLTPTLGKPFARKGAFIHKNGTDLAGFFILYDTSFYAFYLAKNERASLVNAVSRYIRDFDEKNLDSKLKKSERAYGQSAAYEEFGIAEPMMTNFSKPNVYFGYKFLKGSPYFCIQVAPAENLAVNTKSDGAVKQSIGQRYFFTKAQAQALASFLSEENISRYYGSGLGTDLNDIQADSY